MQGRSANVDFRIFPQTNHARNMPACNASIDSPASASSTPNERPASASPGQCQYCWFTVSHLTRARPEALEPYLITKSVTVTGM